MDTSGTQKSSALAFVMRMGLILGAVEILNLLEGYYSGQLEKGGNTIVELCFMVLLGVVAVLLTKKFRDRSLGGYIPFGKAFSLTLQSFTLAAILSAAFRFVFIHVLHHEFLEKMFKTQEQELVAKGLPDEKVEMAMKTARLLTTNPAIFFSIQVVGGVILGLIIGLIVAAICKREPHVIVAD